MLVHESRTSISRAVQSAEPRRRGAVGTAAPPVSCNASRSRRQWAGARPTPPCPTAWQVWWLGHEQGGRAQVARGGTPSLKAHAECAQPRPAQGPARWCSPEPCMPCWLYEGCAAVPRSSTSCTPPTHPKAETDGQSTQEAHNQHSRAQWVTHAGIQKGGVRQGKVANPPRQHAHPRLVHLTCMPVLRSARCSSSRCGPSWSTVLVGCCTCVCHRRLGSADAWLVR